MKNLISFFALLVLFLFPQTASSQGIWQDDFQSSTIGSDWYQNSHYTLSQSNGMLKISTRKYVMWASFGVNIPVQDMSPNPVVNISLKTDNPFQLTVYLFSEAGNVLITQPVMVSDEFTMVSCDFSGLDISDKVLKAVNGIGFAFNGPAISWSGTVLFEEVRVGSSALKYAGIAALPNMSFFQGSTGHKIFVRGLVNAASLQLTGLDAILENVTIEPITPEGTSWVHFDCKAGANESLSGNLIAVASPGYVNNTIHFSLDVEANRVPTLDDMPGIQASAGKLKTIELTGISDGNGTAVQDLLITATSDNALITHDPQVSYQQGSRYASLTFTPLVAGSAVIIVSVNDQSASANIISKTFVVEVLEGWNEIPDLGFIPSLEILNNAGPQTITLKGISDGDDGSQELILTARSSDTDIIPDPVIAYSGGKTATLSYEPIPAKSGIVTITLTLTDNGGQTGNNGNRELVKTFTIETYNPPLSGYIVPFAGAAPEAYDSIQAGKSDYWLVERLGVAQEVSFVKDGEDDVFQLKCTDKGTWTGVWYYTPDMDLTDFPLMSMWVKSDKAILVHIYFWDDSIRNNEDHHLEFPVPANTWTKLNFDFSDPEGMLNSDGKLVNAKRITRVLFNYHPNYNWPFTNWSGTVHFKDIRIGNESGITPTNYCTIDPVGPQTYFAGNEPKTIRLTGISRGKDNLADVSVSSQANLTGLNISEVINGEAIISFSPSIPGKNIITVNVSGAEIEGKTPVPASIIIPLAIVDETEGDVAAITTNPTETHQLYYGLGAKNPDSNLLDLYTLDFGASAIRFGVLDNNQVEPLNDNEDPNVLDMSKLNYDAFDWDYVRNLKARGVETFLLTFWSPPAWMKENLSTNYQMAAAPTWESTDNKVLTAMYDEYAEDMLAAVKMFKQEADIDLAGLGIQNEPAFCEPYASAILSPDKFADMIVRVGKRFEAEGITTRLYAAEQVGGVMSDGPVYNHASYLAAFDATSETQKYSDIFAVHGYAGDGIQPGVPPGSAGWASVFQAINSKGKTRELWMTETEPGYSGWNDAFNNAADILTGFESGNVSLWTEWAWDSHCVEKGKPTQKLWAQSMFSPIRPGARRITSSVNNNDILITSWINDSEHGGKTILVLMNKGLEPVSISLSQEDMPQKYKVYRCSENLARFKDIQYIKGDKLLLGSKSILTLVSGVEGVPGMADVSNHLAFIDAGQSLVSLSNITDGYETNQYPVSIEYSLSDNSILSNVSLSYTSPAETGTFSFRPAKAGATEVTLTITAHDIVTIEKFSIIVKDYSLPTINPVTANLTFVADGELKKIDLSGITDGGDGGQEITVTAEIGAIFLENSFISDLNVNYTSPSQTGELTFAALSPGTAGVIVSITDAGPEGKNTTEMYLTITISHGVFVDDSGYENVKLYPSPAIDKVFLEYPENTFARYSIYTADGMLVCSRNISGLKTEIDTSVLSRGFYMLVLEGSGGKRVMNFVK
jgi:O-glycosyl hydrolase